MKESNSEKIISLYKFIAEFCKIKNKIIVDDSSYIWNCKLKDIENDDENIDIVYKDVLEIENDDNNNNELDYILKVHKPEFKMCPQPDEILIKWLNPEWDNYKKELIIKEKIETENSKTHELEIELFSDDKKREQIFNIWNNERNIWIEKQKKLKRPETFLLNYISNTMI